MGMTEIGGAMEWILQMISFAYDPSLIFQAFETRVVMGDSLE
jgi:hypothetical protein